MTEIKEGSWLCIVLTQEWIEGSLRQGGFVVNSEPEGNVG